MITILGKGVSSGISKGPLYFFQRQKAEIAKFATQDAAAELARLSAAQQQSIDQLNALAETCRAEAGDEMAILFETHAMFVEDEDFAAYMTDLILEEGCSAEYAAEEAGKYFSAMFAALEDPYMQARAADMLDVAARIRNNLLGCTACGIDTDVPVILAADDLVPSETVQLDRSKILGFITQGGSSNSHTAILARTMGIPAVCGAEEALRPHHGSLCYLDGDAGQLILQPDPSIQSALEEKLAAQQHAATQLQALKGKEDVTLDGQTIQLCCNIGTPEDVDDVLQNDGRGIGLFRSEFLYLQAGDYPSEEDQFAAYRAVVSSMGGKPVIIRTLDIGADKQIDYFHMSPEANPALGVRAIRICLNRPDVFHTQLRALYRASAYGNLSIMFPMITSVWEVQACKDACTRVMAELEADGIPYNRNTKLGIMIETPASVLIAEELAQMVDFFSVGTNDLTQYILACDRQSNDLDRFFDPHHPALLRAIKIAADAAHKAGIWIGICGELAADRSMLPVFLAMGIDELSVVPSSILPLRGALRQIRATACTLDALRI